MIEGDDVDWPALGVLSNAPTAMIEGDMPFGDGGEDRGDDIDWPTLGVV